MQGTAHIIVRDKNGKIKSDIKKHNTITNAFYNAMQAYCSSLSELNKNQVLPLQLSPDTYSGITIHDQVIADDKDIQLTRLSGGQKAAISGNTNYTAAATHSVTKNKITNVWAWGIDSAFTMKSIALRHNDFISNGLFAKGGLAGARGLKISADAYTYQSHYYNGSASNTQYYAGVVYDRLPDLTRLEKVFTHRNTGGSIGSSNVYNTVCPLYNDECMIISGSNAVVLDDADVVNYSTATAKRTIALNLFTDRQTVVYATVPTPEKDYLISASATKLCVHEIPRTATSEAIAPVLSVTMPSAFDTKCSIVVIGRYAYIGYNNSNAGHAEIRFNSDGTITHREGYTRAVGMYTTNGSYGDMVNNRACYLYLLRSSNEMVNPYLLKIVEPNTTPNETAADVSVGLSGRFGLWHNQTYLNLAAPIELAAGDTLTVSYSISVGTSTDEGETENSSN